MNRRARMPMLLLLFLAHCRSVQAGALSVPASTGDAPQLRFRNGKFKVIQLTDLHLGESEQQNAASYQVRRSTSITGDLRPLELSHQQVVQLIKRSIVSQATVPRVHLDVVHAIIPV
jgi:hypothetical protein